MWEIHEHCRIDRQLKKAPLDIQKQYEKWKDIVMMSGPRGLRLIKGFRDESLKGQWKGHRSSRLSQQYRVVYRVKSEQILVEIISVTAHDYRKR